MKSETSIAYETPSPAATGKRGEEPFANVSAHKERGEDERRRPQSGDHAYRRFRCGSESAAITAPAAERPRIMHPKPVEPTWSTLREKMGKRHQKAFVHRYTTVMRTSSPRKRGFARHRTKASPIRAASRSGPPVFLVSPLRGASGSRRSRARTPMLRSERTPETRPTRPSRNSRERRAERAAEVEAQVVEAGDGGDVIEVDDLG